MYSSIDSVCGGYSSTGYSFAPHIYLELPAISSGNSDVAEVCIPTFTQPLVSYSNEEHEVKFNYHIVESGNNNNNNNNNNSFCNDRPLTISVMPKSGLGDPNENPDFRIICGNNWGDDSPSLTQLADIGFFYYPFGAWTDLELINIKDQKKQCAIYYPKAAYSNSPDNIHRWYTTWWEGLTYVPNQENPKGRYYKIKYKSNDTENELKIPVYTDMEEGDNYIEGWDSLDLVHMLKMIEDPAEKAKIMDNNFTNEDFQSIVTIKPDIIDACKTNPLMKSSMFCRQISNETWRHNEFVPNPLKTLGDDNNISRILTNSLSNNAAGAAAGAAGGSRKIKKRSKINNVRKSKRSVKKLSKKTSKRSKHFKKGGRRTKRKINKKVKINKK